ncbi:hypothetical protein SAMN05421858_3719 [Haladaptatus litoreus]|uniref:DUF354 domain-containing protein n=1 Tax=Haladaptatus litoreus TaxID=553468 RepID=A0A1N7DLJ5_9EURY|nr:DUF354 domain-containing protein [Haladaptatus litoreus]SIR76595.1 hypothetical protein SAMN05421858_3719 [Haladaptatus litoreus]
MVRRPSTWIDLVSPSHPFFFRGLVDALPNLETNVTVREKTETVGLAEEVGFDYTTLGRDFDNTLLRKFGIPLRTLQLMAQAPSADVSLSSRNAMCILASKARGIPSIHFTDNDITAHVDGLKYEELYNRLEAQATYNVVPSAFETEELTKWGADPEQIIAYDGYKEDIYIADFEPDSSFTDKLPFEEYIVVRPEALDAAYVDAERSLVPDILDGAVERGFNVVYLPRGRGDEQFATPYPSNRVFVPERALNGLELAWHSQCVLTGSGTMAREAGCMDKPAVSFFPNSLLSVDQMMVENNKILHTRSVDDVLEYLVNISNSDIVPNISRSKTVREEVVSLVQERLN